MLVQVFFHLSFFFSVSLTLFVYSLSQGWVLSFCFFKIKNEVLASVLWVMPAAPFPPCGYSRLLTTHPLPVPIFKWFFVWLSFIWSDQPPQVLVGGLDLGFTRHARPPAQTEVKTHTSLSRTWRNRFPVSLNTSVGNVCVAVVLPQQLCDLKSAPP